APFGQNPRRLRTPVPWQTADRNGAARRSVSSSRWVRGAWGHPTARPTARANGPDAGLRRLALPADAVVWAKRQLQERGRSWAVRRRSRNAGNIPRQPEQFRVTAGVIDAPPTRGDWCSGNDFAGFHGMSPLWSIV